MRTSAAESTWLELIGDLMTTPLQALPEERLALALCATFDSTACSFTRFAGTELVGGGLWPTGEDLCGHRDEMGEWVRTSGDRHPLLRYYRSTGIGAPMQVTDVPRDVVGTAVLDGWGAIGRSIGCPDQLSLPLQLDAAGHRAFVLGRPGRYHPAELQLADLLWRLLRGLDRQIATLARAPEDEQAGDVRRAVGLTPRQSAVLVLLGDGLTAGSIARRLTISTRTVEKHLEHIYSKLHVVDRMGAVTRAQQWGIL